jgi:hypothetical protein
LHEGSVAESRSIWLEQTGWTDRRELTEHLFIGAPIGTALSDTSSGVDSVSNFSLMLAD